MGPRAERIPANFDLGDVPKVVYHLQHTLLACEIAYSSAYEREGWGPSSPEALEIAHRMLTAPENNRQKSLAGGAIIAAWAVYKKLQALGWKDPSEVAAIKKKTKGLAIRAAVTKRAKK